jgi:hypothetical protein
MRPTTCVVAADEPDTAANIEQPSIVVCSRRPGRKATHGAIPENSDCDRRVRNSSSPIRMNSGSETISEDVRMLNDHSAICRMVGRLVNTSSNTMPMPISAGPIQIPAISVTVISTSSQVRMAVTTLRPRRPGRPAA